MRNHSLGSSRFSHILEYTFSRDTAQVKENEHIIKDDKSAKFL